MTSLTILATIMFLPAFVIVLAIIWRRQVRERAQAVVEPLSVEGVEYLARTVRTRAVFTLLALAAGTEVAARHDLVAAVVMLFPLVVWIVFGAMHGIVTANRVLGLAGLGELTAEARYNRIDVIACGRHAVLHAAPRLVGRAREHAIPGATL